MGVSEGFPEAGGSRLRESSRVFLASCGGHVRSDQGVSEAVPEPAMAVHVPFRGSPRAVFLCVWGGPANSVQGGSEAFPGGRRSRLGSPQTI